LLFELLAKVRSIEIEDTSFDFAILVGVDSESIIILIYLKLFVFINKEYARFHD